MTQLEGAGARAGVIDLGSNSIRLVVFDDLGRVPQPVFNERMLCGLGQGLAETGRLYPTGVAAAQRSLSRYAALASAMAVTELHVLATEATRVAEDGPDFVQAVEVACGIDVTQLSGDQEAQFSGMGVIAGIPDATGTVADLGGGSLELAGVADGEVGEVASLPLGTLRLAGSIGRASQTAKEHLKDVGWLSRQHGQTLYAVGGAWRSLARVYMVQNHYPLRMIHQFGVAGADMMSFCDAIVRGDEMLLSGVGDISKRRTRSIPAAATVLGRLLAVLDPPEVVFSANGIREGYLFAQLGAAERATDPLLAGCQDLASRESRFGESGALIDDWIAPLFADDSPAAARLRRAACLIADVGWHEHPDYRPEQAFFRILRLPLSGIRHDERAGLALAIYVRYGGASGDHALRAVDHLLDEPARRWARAVGAALRLAETLSGGLPSLLASMPLTLNDGEIRLDMTPERRALDGDVVRRRLKDVGKLLGKPAAVAD